MNHYVRSESRRPDDRLEEDVFAVFTRRARIPPEAIAIASQRTVGNALRLWAPERRRAVSGEERNERKRERGPVDADGEF